jgi:hypothetical protein
MRRGDSPIELHAATAPAGTRLPQRRLSSEGAELAAAVRRMIDSNNFGRGCELLTGSEVSHVKEALVWQDQRGNTLLHTCVEAEGNSRHTPNAEEAQKLIVFLLRRRANVNAQNNRGETPLHVAAQAGNLDVCRLLHKFQGDLEIRRNVDKRRPEDVASHFGHHTVFEFLESIRLRDGGSGSSPLVGLGSSTHGVPSRSTTPRQAAPGTASTTAQRPPKLQPPPHVAHSEGGTPQSPLDGAAQSSVDAMQGMDEHSHFPLHPVTPTNITASSAPPRPTSALLPAQAPRALTMNSKLQQRFTNDDGRRHKESQENKWKLDEFREKNRRLATELRTRSLQAVEELEAVERRRLSSEAAAAVQRLELQERAAVEYITISIELRNTNDTLRQCRSDADAAAIQNAALAATIAALEDAAAEQTSHLTAVAESLGALRDQHIELEEEMAALKETHQSTLATLSSLEANFLATTEARSTLVNELAQLTAAHHLLEQQSKELNDLVAKLQSSSESALSEKSAEVERLTQLLNVTTVQHAAEKGALQASWNESRLEAAALREALTSAMNEVAAVRFAGTSVDAAVSPRAPTPAANSPRRVTAMEIEELRGRAEAATKALAESQQIVTSTAAQLAAKSAECVGIATAHSETQQFCSRLSTELKQTKSELSESEAARVRSQLELDDLRRIVATIGDGAAPEGDLISNASRASIQTTDPQHAEQQPESITAIQELKKQLAHEKQQSSKRIAQAEALTAAAKRDLAAATKQLSLLKDQLESTGAELTEQISARNSERAAFSEQDATLRCTLNETRSSLTAALEDMKQRLAGSEKRYADLQQKSTSLFNAEEGRLQLESTIAELRLELSTIRANRQETLNELRSAHANAQSAEKARQRSDAELDEVRSAHKVALLRLEDLERIRGDNAILTAERNDFKRDAQEAKSVFVLLEKDHDMQLHRVTCLEEQLHQIKKSFGSDACAAQRRQLELEEVVMRKEVALVHWEAMMCLQQSIASSIMELAVHAFRLSANAQSTTQRSLIPPGPRRVVMDPTASTMRSNAPNTATSSLAVRAVSALRNQYSDTSSNDSTATPPAAPQPHPPARPSSATVRRDLEDAELGIAHDDSADDLLPPPVHILHSQRHNRPLSAALHGRQTHAVIEVLEPSHRVSFSYARVGPFLYSTSHESVREFYVNQCDIHRVRPIPDVVALLPEAKDLHAVIPSVAEGGENGPSSSAGTVLQLSVANLKTLCRSSCRAVMDLFYLCPNIQLLDLSGTSSSDAAILYLLLTLEVLCGYEPESPYAASAADVANSWRHRLQCKCSLKELILNGTLVSDVQLLSSLASLVKSLTSVSVQRCKLLRDSSIPLLEGVLAQNRSAPTVATLPNHGMTAGRPMSAAAATRDIDVSSMLKMKMEASALHFGRGRRPYSAATTTSSRNGMTNGL